MASTTIWLARHGEVHNPANVLYGRLPRIRLTPEGRRQARALADFLASRPLAAIYSSPMLRARRTAEAVLASRSDVSRVHIDADLHEVRNGRQGLPLQAPEPIDYDLYAHPRNRDDDDRLRLVFIRRSPFGRHGGQIAFPGGRREPEDPDLLATALREAEEEIGLDRASVEILATLPVIETIATGFRVAPFLGRLTGPPPVWRRQEREIDEILEVPLEDLLHPEAHAIEHWQLPGWSEPREIPFYRI